MGTYTVIEVNSTFVEMKIYEKKEEGYKVLEKVTEDINFLKEIKDKDEISLEKMRKLCEILKKMDNLSRDYGVIEKKIMFSEFFKTITNFPMILDQIKLKVNLPIENIDLGENTYYYIKKLIYL